MSVVRLFVSTLFLAGISLLILAPTTTTATAFWDLFPKTAIKISGTIFCSKNGGPEEGASVAPDTLISVFDRSAGSVPKRIGIQKGNPDGTYVLKFGPSGANTWRIGTNALFCRALIHNCSKLAIKGTMESNYTSFAPDPTPDGYYLGTPEIL